MRRQATAALKAGRGLALLPRKYSKTSSTVSAPRTTLRTTASDVQVCQRQDEPVGGFAARAGARLRGRQYERAERTDEIRRPARIGPIDRSCESQHGFCVRTA